MADRLRGLTVVVTPQGVVRTVKWDGEKRKRGLLRRSRWVQREGDPGGDWDRAA